MKRANRANLTVASATPLKTVYMGLCRARVTATSTVAVPLIGIISPLSASKWVQNLLICAAVLPRHRVHKVGWTNTQMEYRASGHDYHQGACIIAERRRWWLLISPLFLFDFLLPEVLPVAAAVSTLSGVWLRSRGARRARFNGTVLSEMTNAP